MFTWLWYFSRRLPHSFLHRLSRLLQFTHFLLYSAIFTWLSIFVKSHFIQEIAIGRYRINHLSMQRWLWGWLLHNWSKILKIFVQWSYRGFSFWLKPFDGSLLSSKRGALNLKFRNFFSSKSGFSWWFDYDFRFHKSFLFLLLFIHRISLEIYLLNQISHWFYHYYITLYWCFQSLLILIISYFIHHSFQFSLIFLYEWEYIAYGCKKILLGFQVSGSLEFAPMLFYEVDLTSLF